MSGYGVLDIDGGKWLRIQGEATSRRLDQCGSSCSQKVFEYLDDNVVLENEPMEALTAIGNYRSISIMVSGSRWTPTGPELLNNSGGNNSPLEGMGVTAMETGYWKHGIPSSRGVGLLAPGWCAR